DALESMFDARNSDTGEWTDACLKARRALSMDAGDGARKHARTLAGPEETPAYWRYMMPDFSHGMASDRDSIPHDATIVKPVYTRVTHLTNDAPPDPTAVAPKGVVETLDGYFLH